MLRWSTACFLENLAGRRLLQAVIHMTFSHSHTVGRHNGRTSQLLQSPDVGFDAPADPCCMQDHFHQILPEADIEAVNAMYTEAAEEQLLGGSPDFVLDAIDNIDTKVELLAACRRRGLPVLSSAGAGMGFVAASLAECDTHTVPLCAMHRTWTPVL